MVSVSPKLCLSWNQIAGGDVGIADEKRGQALRKRAVVACVVIWLGQALGAQQVSIVLPPGAEDLRGPLDAASLTTSLTAAGTVTPQDYVAAARADYRRMLTGLYALGYFGGTVSITIDGQEVAGIAPLDAPAQIGAVVIAIDPGPQFTFGQVAVGPLAPDTVPPDSFQTGQVAQTDAVRAAVRAAVTGWQDLGHAKATAGAQQIVAQHATNMLDVAVQIAPGPRLTFGALTVTGNSGVRADRIIAIAGLPTGQVYSPAEVAFAEARLRRTGAFSSAALVESDTYTPDLTLPFTAQVSEQKPRRLGFGAELSSLDGITLSGYWLHRNLLGGAERLRLDAAISGIGTADSGPDLTLGADFGRPATINANTDLIISAGIERLDEPDYFLWQATASVGFIKYVRDDLTYEGSLGLLTAREEIAGQTRDYTLLTLPLRATLDRRDDKFDATRGYFADAQATPFLGLSGGADGGRLYADARAYRSFGDNDRFTFAARAQIGSVLGADLTHAPADFLFYAGGGSTVRGQPYQSLGVTTLRNTDAGPVSTQSGGASFVGAQIEGRFDVTAKIGLVGFYDVALIGADNLPQSGDDWIAGAGIGLRYDTPIGPIRLDLATPASGDDIGKSLQIYIGIGQSF